MNDVTFTVTYDQHLLLREAAGHMSAKYSKEASKCKLNGDMDGYEKASKRSQELMKCSLRLMGI